MALEHIHALQKTIEETEPNKLKGLSLQALQSYYERLSAILPYLLDGRLVTSCRDRMELLRREIELLRIEERSERQHQAAFGLGTKTLFWARLAVLAAIVVPVILALISRFAFSKLLPAKIGKASPPTYPQTPAPRAALPVPEARSSTAAPSPEQTPTAQPSSPTPPESEHPRTQTRPKN